MNAFIWATLALFGGAPFSDPRIDPIFQVYDRPDSPGCAVGVYQNGAVVEARGFGMANLETGAPITPETVFYVGSVSKQFTAMSVALAFLQGKLSLDDPVSKFLPELRDFGEPITIRNFIHHTSGLREKWDLLEMSGWRDGDVVSIDDVLDRASRLEDLNFLPGEEHLYNNTAYDLLSVIILRATGRTLAEFAKENIFEPLGMKDSRFVDDRTLVIPRRATGYASGDEGRFRVNLPNVTTTGSGSVYTTVRDLALWDESFYSGKLGGPELVKLVTTPGRLDDGVELTYAFGLSVDTFRGLKRVEHGGALAGYRAQITRFPEKHFTVTVLCNAGDADPGALATRVAEIYLGLPPEPKIVPVEVGSAARFAGTYFDERTGLAQRIDMKDGALMLDSNRRLEPLGADRFRVSGASEIQFSGTGFTWTATDARPAVYTRVEPSAPTAAELSAYAGSFESRELDVTWDIEAADALTLKRARFPVETLEPWFRDGFDASLGFLHFRRDDQGAVTGFTISTGRTRHLRFEKTKAQPAKASSWQFPADSQRCPSKWGASDERGSANHMGPKSVLRARELIRSGEVIELAHVLSSAMPFFGTRRFDVHTKRTNMNPGTNRRGSNEELVVSEMGQVGTQFDGFAHQTHEDSWYNCLPVAENATRSGFTKLGIEKVGTLMTRGVLLDVAGLKGVDMLPDGYEITVEDLEAALARQKLTLQPGDAVVIHTGWGKLWAKDNARYVKSCPGIGIRAAEWIAEKDPMLLGSDNWPVEVAPNPDPDLSLPIHQIALVVKGIHLLENMKLDELAAKEVYEFAFLIQPLKMQGASGSTVSPVAIR